MRNSVYITGGALALQMTLGISLAYLTMGSSWRMRAIRTLLILPMVIAPVAAGTLWRILLNSRAGLVNHLLSHDRHQGTGVAGVARLGDRIGDTAGYLAVDAIRLAGGRRGDREHPRGLAGGGGD